MSKNDNEFNYMEDIDINPDDLVTEWKQHSMTYMRYQKESIKRDKIKTKAKDNMEIKEAELNIKVRKELSETHEKVTEIMIKSIITLHKDRIKAFNNYLNKIYKSKIIDAAVKAFEHRKKALEKMVELWLGSYYSEPKSNKSNENIRKVAEDFLSEKVRKNIKRK